MCAECMQWKVILFNDKEGSYETSIHSRSHQSAAARCLKSKLFHSHKQQFGRSLVRCWKPYWKFQSGWSHWNASWMRTHIVSELACHQSTTPTRFIPCVFGHLRIAANSKNHERKLNEIVLKTVIVIRCWRSVWSRQLWQRPLSFWCVIHRKVSLEPCIQKNLTTSVQILSTLSKNYPQMKPFSHFSNFTWCICELRMFMCR